MERYSGGQTTEGEAADPVVEWAGQGGETGLEEPMWHLGLNSGNESYMERPEEADCMYYLRTGFCGYGARCRFNHPRDRVAVVGAMRASGGDYPERVGQPICQYYMRTGLCKFGSSCKFHHPREANRSTIPVALNIYGLPLRPGERDCAYYMKSGQCKFGVTCKYHHPHLTGANPGLGPGPLSGPAPVPVPVPLPVPVPALYPPPPVQSSQPYGVVTTGNWPVPRPPLLPGSYIPGTYAPLLYPPGPGMMPLPGWSPYPAPPVNQITSSSTQQMGGAGPVYGVSQVAPPAYTGQYLSVAPPTPPPPPPSSSSNQRENLFPERPGQPECQYYMKTGDCKYGSSCKYHHPSDWSGPINTNPVLTHMGLPLRPGAPICSHYAQNGMCKFGPACRFDHPIRSMSYNTSSSSIADIPVAPYPVGSSMATLAQSSSSSDLKPVESESAPVSSSMDSSGGQGSK